MAVVDESAKERVTEGGDAGASSIVVPGEGSAAAIAPSELSAMRDERERLKLELDNAKLQAKLTALGKSWWRRAPIVTALTTMIAAVVPVTTAVQAHYQKARDIALQESKQAHDIALQESKQAHDIRSSYLDRLDKPGARLRTLRFVLATTADSTLRSWAEEEKKQVDAEINAIVRRIAELRAASVVVHKAPTPSSEPSISTTGGRHETPSAAVTPNKQLPATSSSKEEVLSPFSLGNVVLFGDAAVRDAELQRKIAETSRQITELSAKEASLRLGKADPRLILPVLRELDEKREEAASLTEELNLLKLLNSTANLPREPDHGA